jgi:hypothetical protein
MILGNQHQRKTTWGEFGHSSSEKNDLGKLDTQHQRKTTWGEFRHSTSEKNDRGEFRLSTSEKNDLGEKGRCPTKEK